MILARQFVWLAVGFALATLLGLAVDPRPASAQSSGSSLTAISPPPRPQAVVPRATGLPVPFDPNAADPRLRGTTVPAPVSEDQATDSETEDASGDGDATDREATAGQRRALRDGDPVPTEGFAAPRDGIVLIGEPRGPADGADATQIDTRPPEDIAVFENPPAGFDAQLFQAEVDPILDRRPERLFRFEPFDARGVRLGTFVLFPEAELGSTFYSNLFRSSQPRSDVAFDVRPTARLVSNWRAHALEFRANGTLNYFNEFTTENDRAYTLEARGRVDVSRRTNLESLVSRDVTQDSRSSINASAAATSRADITTDRLAVALNQKFNRLGLQLRGSVAETDYGATASTGGGTISNRDRDVQTTEEAVRASWEFKPTLFGFIEAGFNQREYKVASLSDGIRRDSTGDRTRVGVSFGNTGQKLRGEASIGYGRQRPDDSRLRDIEGVIVDANLAYRLSTLTSVLLTARSDVTETTLAGSAGALSRQVGAELRHGFTRQLIGTAGLSYTLQDYAGVALTEREARSTLGMEYFLNREVTLFSRYQHTAFNSDDSTRNYNADEVRVGVRVRQ